MTALDPNNALMMTAHPLAALVRHPASPTTVLNEATDGSLLLEVKLAFQMVRINEDIED